MTNVHSIMMPVAPKWRDRSFRVAAPTHNPSSALVPETGPLSALQGRKVLAIFDIENLTISTRKLGFELDYGALARRLGASTRTVQLHAALSVEPGDTVDFEHIAASGFTVHSRVIETLRDGSKAANSDNVFAFQTGLLVSRSRADVVILGSGDGQLICDLANSIRDLPSRRSVWTLSIPGATSTRLDSRRNRSIETNVEVGLDVLMKFGEAERRIHAS